MDENLLAGNRICVVLLSGIGDVVHGLPVVNALKRDAPERNITWVVQSEPAPLLQPHPSIDRVITFDRKKGLSDIRRLWRELRPLEFDLVINFNIYFKSIIPTFTARAPDKISFGRDRARDLVWLFANHRLSARPIRHTQDHFLEFLDYLAIPVEPLEWKISLTDDEREQQREFFARFDDQCVVGIVATTARHEKDWQTEHFADVATALERDFNMKVVLLGGPGLREQARARALAERTEADTEWALGDDLRRLTYLVDGCDLLIAGDTGPLHIARALETPVIGLFGHTDPRRAGPYRAFEDLVVDRFNFDAPGQPADFSRPGARDLRTSLISVDDVLEKVRLAVERLPSDRPPA
jgi:heptosyltransferase I